WLVCGLDLAASVADLPPTAPQRLEGLTFDQHGLEETSTARLASVSRAGQLLTSELVEQARREAVADWITTGLTPGQILALQNATVQITDLNSEGAFGFAGSRLIQLDDDALGFGWHVGSGPVPTGAVDLGTVMRHELGHILGYGDLDPATAGDSIMSGTILPGERRTVPINATEAPEVSASDVKAPAGLTSIPSEVKVNNCIADVNFAGAHGIFAAAPSSAPAQGGSRPGRRSAALATVLPRSSHSLAGSDVIPECQNQHNLESLDEIFADLLWEF
ncbi:MAG: hypothetical protein ACK58J_21775, partial [Planctomyces sp.]